MGRASTCYQKAGDMYESVAQYSDAAAASCTQVSLPMHIQPPESEAQDSATTPLSCLQSRILQKVDITAARIAAVRALTYAREGTDPAQQVCD